MKLCNFHRTKSKPIFFIFAICQNNKLSDKWKCNIPENCGHRNLNHLKLHAKNVGLISWKTVRTKKLTY